MKIPLIYLSILAPLARRYTVLKGVIVLKSEASEIESGFVFIHMNMKLLYLKFYIIAANGTK